MAKKVMPLNDVDSEKMAKPLSKLLADSYSLYLKTHNYHWNVTGPMFNSLHTMFEEQYTELATAVDEIAERIRAVGHPAPGSWSEFGELTSIEEGKPGTKALEMVRRLAQDHMTVAASANEVFKVAEKIDDDVSADLATQRRQIHEKTAWMLRSHLEES
jgi:starvation-inducible DNA-binding protein